MTFLTQKMAKNSIKIKSPGEALSTFIRASRDPKGEQQLCVVLSKGRAKNTSKSEPFKTKNNAQTLPKQLQNNFEKVQKTIFSTPKKAKTRVST